MKIAFEKMDDSHQTAVMDIFNDYIEHSFAAFPSHKLPYPAYAKLMEKAGAYPAYSVKDADSGRVVGFCFLSAYNPFPTFNRTAEISYFLAKDVTGRGIGTQCLARLENDALQRGIRTLLATISSKNTGSIAFHEKHGFTHCGTLKNVGQKFNESFDVVIMQKNIAND